MNLIKNNDFLNSLETTPEATSGPSSTAGPTPTGSPSPTTEMSTSMPFECPDMVWQNKKD